MEQRVTIAQVKDRLFELLVTVPSEQWVVWNEGGGGGCLMQRALGTRSQAISQYLSVLEPIHPHMIADVIRASDSKNLPMAARAVDALVPGLEGVDSCVACRRVGSGAIGFMSEYHPAAIKVAEGVPVLA